MVFALHKNIGEFQTHRQTTLNMAITVQQYYRQNSNSNISCSDTKSYPLKFIEYSHWIYSNGFVVYARYVRSCTMYIFCIRNIRIIYIKCILSLCRFQIFGIFAVVIVFNSLDKYMYNFMRYSSADDWITCPKKWYCGNSTCFELALILAKTPLLIIWKSSSTTFYPLTHVLLKFVRKDIQVCMWAYICMELHS